MKRYLTPLSDKLSADKQAGFGLLVDITAMSGYDPEARALYISWHSSHRDRLKKVAVVTDKAMWRMMIATVGLAAKGDMRAFENAATALSWVRG